MLNPDITFLNHGSFGACPRPVFEAYQNWQRELEYQPVEFLARRIDGLLDTAREKLAQYLNAPTNDIIFVQNATTGVNMVARSLKLNAGDEVLTTDHEYGACNFTWDYFCRQHGAVYVEREMPIPMTTHADFVEHFWAGVTPRTKVIFLSHITSFTALIFPVQEICRRAREAGIITVIDGAHAPAQISLDLTAIGADFYTGNCHKWLCAPKGSAFLYVNPAYQADLAPLVISWGWTPESDFINRHQVQPTRDHAAYLSVPAAIEYQAAHQWGEVRAACHAMICELHTKFEAFFGLPMLTTDPDVWNGQMLTVPVPPCDLSALKTRLYDEYQIEMPIIPWKGGHYIRVSVQVYNSAQQMDYLFKALGEIFV